MILASILVMGTTGVAAIFTSHCRGWFPRLLVAAHLASIAATCLLLWHTIRGLPLG